MIIGFDAKRFFLNYTGLGNYSRFVVNALSEHFPDNNYVLFSPKVRSHPDVDSVVSRSNVRIVTPPEAFRLVKSLWRTVGIGFHGTSAQLNVYHGLSHELPIGLPRHVGKVVTVHDLIFLRYPEFYKSVDVLIYKMKVTNACRNADVVVAISEQTASDIHERLGVEREKIRVVYQGCHPIFAHTWTDEEKLEIRTRLQLPSEYILTVGTIEKRKNQKLIVEALPKMKQSKIPFVVVGKSTEYLNEIKSAAQRLKVLDRIIFLHDVEWKDLPGLYQMASVFVYPSLFEGFGIPILEAITSGIPVIAAATSCLPEAGGPDAIYVDPLRAENLAEQLDIILDNRDIRETMVKRSLAYVKKFEAPRIASELESIYRELARS